eukprot:g44526.t1
MTLAPCPTLALALTTVTMTLAPCPTLALALTVPHPSLTGYGVWEGTDALSFYHRNIRGWLEGLRAHPARRALLLDAKERDYKKAEAMRVPDYVSIRDRPLESIGDSIDSPRYEDYLKNLPLEDVKNWLSLCWSWDASPIQKVNCYSDAKNIGGLTGGAYDTWAALCELFGAMDPDSKFGSEGSRIITEI